MIEPGAEVFNLKILNPVPFIQAIPGPLQRIPSLAIRFWEIHTTLSIRYDATTYHPGFVMLGGMLNQGITHLPTF